MEIARFADGLYLVGPYRLVRLIGFLLRGHTLYGPVHVSGRPNRGMLKLN